MSSPSLPGEGTRRGHGGTANTLLGLTRLYEQRRYARIRRQRERQPSTSSTPVGSTAFPGQRSVANGGNTGQAPATRGVAGTPTREDRWDQLTMALGYVIKDAVALSQVADYVQKGQGDPNYRYYQAVEKFTNRYEDILNDRGFPIYLSDLDLESIEKNYQVMLSFTKGFTGGRDKVLPGTRQSNDTETLRVLRALYRRTIFVRLYYAGRVDHGHLDREAYLKDFYGRRLGQVLTRRWAQDDMRVFNGRFLCLFEPWELEQIITVDVFLSQVIVDHAKLRDVLGTLAMEVPPAWAEFLACPLTRLMYDLDYLHRAERALHGELSRVQRERSTTRRNSCQHAQRLKKYLALAPHCFSLEQQALSYRRGYDKRRGPPAAAAAAREHEEAGGLPPFDGDAVDKIPFAWVDAFGGRSPHCRAFGLALPPMRVKFRHFLEGEGGLHITPSDSSPARAAKLSSQATPPSWRGAAGAPRRAFESVGDFRLWVDWCDLGFVMWDRDRVRAMKRPGPDSLGKPFQTGWMDAEALLDVMANVRLRGKDGRMIDPAKSSGA